ncbi:MAG: ATP-binding protein, partial [Anaerovorax sp.]
MNLDDKRIRVIVGHYGSGKSEFSINYAIALAKKGCPTGLVDVDIANPYFRSRECQALLEKHGIDVYSNTFGYDITADLPAITAKIRKPLEDVSCQTVVDAGGDAAGARILNQFYKYFKNNDCDLFCVVNANRSETKTLGGALDHIKQIEE